MALAARLSRFLVAAFLFAPGALAAQEPAQAPRDTTKAPSTLPEITVEADRFAKPPRYAATTKYDDFFRRRKSGFGTFITREAIEKMNAFHTHEIIRNIPGVRVSSMSGDPETVRVSFVRCNGGRSNVAVYIDGQRLIPRGERGQSGDVAEMLSRISAPQIEMMEVYRGTAEVPGELSEDACAAVVIWTRWNPERWPGDTLKRRPDTLRTGPDPVR
jgi:outer membrane cobalamin receptor